jgi:peptidoglycan hydrolase CwlO-like protein
MVRLFKKDSEIIDYTDRGKNIPEIKLDYGITKDGFIEFKDKTASKTSNNSAGSAFDFLNNMATSSSSSLSVNTEISTSAFDFLDPPASSLSSSDNKSDYPTYVGNSEVAGGDLDELKKIIRNVSSMSESNSNEVYQLMQRIEILEKKIEELNK